jgi:hypothetical protein
MVGRRTRWATSAYYAVGGHRAVDALGHRGTTTAQRRLLPSDISPVVCHVGRIPTERISLGGRPPFGVHAAGLHVLDGAWDIAAVEPIDAYLAGYPCGSTVQQLFVERRSVHDVDEYRAMTAELAAGGTPKGARSHEEIDAYFASVVRLHDDIRRNGYRSQAELGAARPGDEIVVHIGRDGLVRKMQGSGHHRLAIARLLGIDAVPVAVRGVHIELVDRWRAEHGCSVLAAVRRGLAEAFNEVAPATA